MTKIDTAKSLTKIGAILLILGGFAEIEIYNYLFWFRLWFEGYICGGSLILIVVGILAVILGFLVLLRFQPKLHEDPRTVGKNLLLVGLLIIPYIFIGILEFILYGIIVTGLYFLSIGIPIVGLLLLLVAGIQARKLHTSAAT